MTDSNTCPVCGEETSEEVSQYIYWCYECNTPIIQPNTGLRDFCPVCGVKTRRLVSDIRPVFPEERLLFELISGLEPNSLVEKSVWANNSRYYIDGEAHPVTVEDILSCDPEELRRGIEHYSRQNSYESFHENISRFIRANTGRLTELTREALAFISENASSFPEENIVVWFSGGKDSTVTADLVVRALGNPYIVHIFGNTTLEFPSTIEYAKRFREDHPLTVFKTAINNDQKFYEVAQEIGPPARMMRWCCSMFKTGPITRAFNSLYGSQEVLTFQGIRKCESVSRSKYNRIESDAESVKINQQRSALPIFNWKNVDVWLYILAEDIDFNDAYRLGYERVGCWCCPNNNERSELLARIYMPEEAEKWHDYLLNFACSIGKPDPEIYINEGWWKARQGGNGLAAAKSVKVEAEQCATEDDAALFSLSRPFSEELVGLFCPVGEHAPGLGKRLLNEYVFLDHQTKEPLFSIMPFSNTHHENAVKVRIIQSEASESVLMMAKYQVRKFNACRQCLKCESLCRFGAIKILAGSYYIDASRCTHCRQCVTDKYLEGGCLMAKYLRTVKGE